MGIPPSTRTNLSKLSSVTGAKYERTCRRAGLTVASFLVTVVDPFELSVTVRLPNADLLQRHGLTITDYRYRRKLALHIDKVNLWQQIR